MGQENDDYGERECPALLEPENLVPLIVIAAVGALLFAFFVLGCA